MITLLVATASLTLTGFGGTQAPDDRTAQEALIEERLTALSGVSSRLSREGGPSDESAAAAQAVAERLLADARHVTALFESLESPMILTPVSAAFDPDYRDAIAHGVVDDPTFARLMDGIASRRSRLLACDPTAGGRSSIDWLPLVRLEQLGIRSSLESGEVASAIARLGALCDLQSMFRGVHGTEYGLLATACVEWRFLFPSLARLDAGTGWSREEARRLLEHVELALGRLAVPLRSAKYEYWSTVEDAASAGRGRSPGDGSARGWVDYLIEYEQGYFERLDPTWEADHCDRLPSLEARTDSVFAHGAYRSWYESVATDVRTALRARAHLEGLRIGLLVALDADGGDRSEDVCGVKLRATAKGDRVLVRSSASSLLSAPVELTIPRPR